MKHLIKNRKGTAEVIGTMLFIVILLFFFTNVYLWHDTATKEANQLFLEKVNSTFKIEQTGDNTINVTANGGSDITLSRLWIADNTLNAPYGEHYYADLNVTVAAGESLNITFSTEESNYNPASPVGVGSLQNSSMQVNYYPPGYSVTVAVINTMGIEETTTFQP
jgi:hypothetical protein